MNSAIYGELQNDFLTGIGLSSWIGTGTTVSVNIPLDVRE
jgi:hypothetical protein